MSNLLLQWRSGVDVCSSACMWISGCWQAMDLMHPLQGYHMCTLHRRLWSKHIAYNVIISMYCKHPYLAWPSCCGMSNLIEGIKISCPNRPTIPLIATNSSIIHQSASHAYATWISYDTVQGESILLLVKIYLLLHTKFLCKSCFAVRCMCGSIVSQGTADSLSQKIIHNMVWLLILCVTFVHVHTMCYTVHVNYLSLLQSEQQLLHVSSLRLWFVFLYM